MSATAAFPYGRRFVVTGASGFVGRHVVQTLRRHGADVIGVQRGEGLPLNAETASITHSLDLATGDIAQLLEYAAADAVIHCAGLIRAPNDNGAEALRSANVTATKRLLQAARDQSRPPKVVLVSSAAIWAPMSRGQLRIDETHPMEPVAEYGRSKADATRIALACQAKGDLEVSVGVPFNLLGPGQPSHLVPSVFIEKLKKDPTRLTIMDPDAVRDWLDVRDVADALVTLAQPDVPPDLYNICSGQGVTVRDLLSALCLRANWRPEVQVVQNQTSRGVSRSVGDPSRLMAASDWRPKLRLDDTLADMLSL